MARELTAEQVAAGTAAAWVHEHAMQANRDMYHRAAARLHEIADELVAVCIGERDADLLSPTARHLLRLTAAKACA